MFCSKCGKEINDDAVFCGFCGAPVNAAPVADSVPQPSEPQMSVPQPVPQPTAPQPTAPQQSAPQMGMPQQGAPQMNAQQPMFTQVNNQNVNNNPAQPAQPVSVNLSFSLDQKMIGYINKGLRAVLVILSLLIFIGAIVTMANAGAVTGDTKYDTALSALKAISNHINYLACAPAIIAFVLSVAGAVFTYLTKQRSFLSYASAGIGLILFIFNFIMDGSVRSIVKNIWFGDPTAAGVIVSGIFMILGALAMAASSVIIILNKEDIIPIKVNF